jgi:hypothetical protein
MPEAGIPSSNKYFLAVRGRLLPKAELSRLEDTRDAANGSATCWVGMNQWPLDALSLTAVHSGW